MSVSEDGAKPGPRIDSIDHFRGLAVILMLNSVISGYYYLRLIIEMFMRDPVGEAPALEPRPSLGSTLSTTGFRRVDLDLHATILRVVQRPCGSGADRFRKAVKGGILRSCRCDFCP